MKALYSKLFHSFLLVSLHLNVCESFVTNNKQNDWPQYQVGKAFHQRRTERYNFFQDLLKDAFENDDTLSSNKGESQIEGPNDEPAQPVAMLTETQQKWRQANPRSAGAPLNSDMLVNTKFELDLFLSGVPSKDPSNDLYGSKTNISNRDRQVGLDVPDEPTVTVQIELLPDGVCEATESAFTSGTEKGQWKLADDGRTLRISIDVVGYSRTVQTKGSIQKVFWSDGEEVTRQTSSSYTIPPGFIFGDVPVVYGTRPGTVKMEGDGILRVEKASGLLGVSSKLVACGKFVGRSILEDGETMYL